MYEEYKNRTNQMALNMVMVNQSINPLNDFNIKIQLNKYIECRGMLKNVYLMKYLISRIQTDRNSQREESSILFNCILFF